MNPGVISIRDNRVMFLMMILIVIGGYHAYQTLGRLEDPEFTIKEALIVTTYPGASPEEVAQEVTNPIESAVQQLGQLSRVESDSSRGRSIVKAVIKDRYDGTRIPQVWDELRRKINDVQPLLPPSARGRSMVIDDFGDVYGIFLAITGEGYTQAELRRYTEFLRRELQTVPGVKKVELFSEQQEVVFLEISRQRLARLGINEESIYALLRSKNAAADGGRVRVGDSHIAIDPKGAFDSAEDMLELVIGSDSTGNQLRLRDVATLQRDSQDPPRRILMFDGSQAVGLGISTVQGGNVVTVGEGIRKKLEDLKPNQPIGIEIGEINFQPEAVSAATDDFIFNLIKAVSIVFIVLMLAMGRKTGLTIGAVLFLTIMATFFVMKMKGDLLMERISLGALIIALCMLTGNAIIVIEGIKVRIEAGEDKLTVVREVVAENQWPLFGATAIGVIAFAAIGLSEDRTGKYCNSLFRVIFISLSLSWVSSITITPLLSYYSFTPIKKTEGDAASGDPYAGKVFRTYRRLLTLALRWRWAVVATSVVAFFVALYGFTQVEQTFFPPATRPQFMVDCFLPAGTHIRESEAFAQEIQQYLREQSGVTHVTSFVGGGGLRFLLVYSPERENPGYVQFLVDVKDPDKIAQLVPMTQKHLDGKYANVNSIAKTFLLGPGDGCRIQARLRGSDPELLRRVSDQVKEVFDKDGGALSVRSDWLQREKTLRPDVPESQARRNGITRVEVANALQSSFEGRPVGFFREPGNSGGGTFPQESRLLPIIARPPYDERNDVSAIHSGQIWSPMAGRMIPLSQVVSGTKVDWEDPAIMRRDRFPTVTVHADPRTGLPSALFNRVRTQIEQIELPPGYSLEWGGEYEDSRDARAAVARPLPMAVIGVAFGLLVTGQPFGFMALLGVLALGGEQIKNAIVVPDKIKRNISEGIEPYQAIPDGGTVKLRPVLMVAITTVLGMIPLAADPFFGSMAVCIMFGLSFACVLTMIVMPVLYAIFFRIHEPANASTAS